MRFFYFPPADVGGALRSLAAMLGATAEFSKWEGITFDTKRNRIYTAMSEIRNGMEDFKGKGEANPEFDVGSSNDIRLEYNPCGCGACGALALCSARPPRRSDAAL